MQYSSTIEANKVIINKSCSEVSLSFSAINKNYKFKISCLPFNLSNTWDLNYILVKVVVKRARHSCVDLSDVQTQQQARWLADGFTWTEYRSVI